jgi:hypothetical protein
VVRGPDPGDPGTDDEDVDVFDLDRVARPIRPRPDLHSATARVIHVTQRTDRDVGLTGAADTLDM